MRDGRRGPSITWKAFSGLAVAVHTPFPDAFKATESPANKPGQRTTAASRHGGTATWRNTPLAPLAALPPLAALAHIGGGPIGCIGHIGYIGHIGHFYQKTGRACLLIPIPVGRRFGPGSVLPPCCQVRILWLCAASPLRLLRRPGKGAAAPFARGRPGPTAKARPQQGPNGNTPLEPGVNSNSRWNNERSRRPAGIACRTSGAA